MNVTYDAIRNGLINLKDRSVRLKCITEIKPENTIYCKRLLQIADVRHLSGIKSNFSIADRKNWLLYALSSEVQPLSHAIHSNIKGIVDAQQYLFDTLWNKATPAEDKIREIEEGIVPDFIKTISDPREIQNLAFELLKSSKEEILIVFSTSNAFYRQIKAGLIPALENAITHNSNTQNLRIKVLTPVDSRISDTITRTYTLNSLKQNKQKHQHETERLLKDSIQIRTIENSFKSRLSILIVDKKFSLVVELKDDTKEASYDAIGLATYSNSKSTVLSYVSIFESLWKQVELYEKIKLHDTLQKDFVSIAAHELRTPIQPILMLSESLKSKVIDNEGNRMADIIHRNAHRLQQLSEDILDIAKIETQTLKVNKSQFDLNNLIRKIVEDRQKEIINNNRLHVKIETMFINNNLLVQADEGRIMQVINNLVNNAIKFTTTGIISIGTKMDNQEEHSSKSNIATIYVKDSGQGINPQIFPKLFEKFATKSSDGTGLGLYISKSIVEAHGGRIWAGNNPHGKKGATFAFSIPLK
jgi:two-component system, OmpR family, sensor histidine kinase VicK